MLAMSAALTPWLVCPPALAQATGPQSAPQPSATAGATPTRTAPPAPLQLNTTERPIILLVPLRERGPLGQVTLRISPGDALAVSAEELAIALSRIVTGEAQARLRGLAAPDGFLSLEAAAEAGYPIAFDPGLLELSVDIPLDARQRRNFSLGFDRDLNQPEDTTDRSSRFAAYLNYRLASDYIQQDEDDEFRPLQMDLEFNGRVFGVAFENQGAFDADSDRDGGFRRQSSRLIYDHLPTATRYSAGDVRTLTTAFQSAPDIGGLNVTRLYGTLRPGRAVDARSSRSITLRRPATVDIRINGASVRTLRLQPGVYDVRDLPVSGGANAVELLIEDDTGLREVVAFDFFSDTTLLERGLDEFSLSAGVRAPRDIDGVDYQSDEPVLAGFYRRGFTEQLTAGANLEAARDAVMGGIDAVYGWGLGLTSLNLAVSNRDSTGSGYAVRVEHRLTTSDNTPFSQRSLSLSVETRSENFGGIDEFDPLNRFGFIGAVRYAQAFGPRLSGSLGLDYALGRNEQPDRYGASASLTYLFERNVLLSMGVQYENDDERGGTNVFASLVKRFGRSTVTASAESRDERANLTYARAPERPINDYALSASLTRARGATGVSGNLAYFGARADAELSHNSVLADDDRPSSQITSARLIGSVAYVDGAFGLGRRITDSFALVRGHPSLDGRPVLIGSRFSREPVARSGPLGPAVVSLNAYTEQNIEYDVQDLPVGYDLGLGGFEVFPHLHSGYRLTVGSAYNVTAVGELLDSSGGLVTLRSGLAVNLDDPKAPQVEVLTNRTGRFGASGLAAGRYRITITGERPIVYEFKVPPDAGELIRTGPLRPVGG
jgi:outer membrane usher protein